MKVMCGGPLPQKVRMFSRTRHYKTSVEKVRVRLSGTQRILASLLFEVFCFLFFVLITTRSKDVTSECTPEVSLMGRKWSEVEPYPNTECLAHG